jgi:hypothetical protein
MSLFTFFLGIWFIFDLPMTESWKIWGIVIFILNIIGSVASATKESK